MADRDKFTAGGLIDYALNRWGRSYRKHPIITVVATVLLFVGSAVVTYIDEQRRREPQVASLSYSEQLQELDQVETSLRRLATFVADQRRNVEEAKKVLDEFEKQQQERLAEAQNEVEEIQNERERLEPLLKADQEIVNSVFALQQHQREVDILQERWWGFGLGVAASICGAVIVNIIGRILRSRRRGY